MTGAGDDDIDLALFGADRRRDAIEVFEFGSVGLNASNATPDQLGRRIERCLPSTKDENVSSLLNEPLRGCKPYTARASADYSDLIFLNETYRLLNILGIWTSRSDHRHVGIDRLLLPMRGIRRLPPLHLLHPAEPCCDGGIDRWQIVKSDSQLDRVFPLADPL